MARKKPRVGTKKNPKRTTNIPKGPNTSYTVGRRKFKTRAGAVRYAKKKTGGRIRVSRYY